MVFISIESDILLWIERRFREGSIQIAYPHWDNHMLAIDETKPNHLLPNKTDVNIKKNAIAA